MRQISQTMLIIVGFLVSTFAYATAQEPDTLILNGNEYSLNTNPLRSYLREIKWTRPEEAVNSSSNWRGYTATWEILDNNLILKNVSIRIVSGDDSVDKSILSSIFPEGKIVIATWYSGALIIPDGEMTKYVHMGYGSMYSHYQVARVKNGQIIELLSLTDEEFSEYKDKKFQEFIYTEEYKKARTQLLKDDRDMTPDELNDFMKSFYAETYLAM